jgi:hypothetical protein
VVDEFSGAVTLARRDRVSPVAPAEFRLVEGAFERFYPTPVPDERSVIGTTTLGFRTADADCYRWRGDDEVNDRPVGKPQEKGMMNIAASFSLSKKPRFVDLVGKSQTQEGDAC